MDLTHLTYFLEVAHYKSFTKASQNLHISQPSISKGIKTLEEKWKVRLFHRHGKTIELTEVGEAILPKIEEIIDRFYRLQEEVSDPSVLRAGKLKVGLPPLIGAFYLTSFLKSFREVYPNIELCFVEEPSGKIENILEDGGIHCGFCAIPTVYGRHETLILAREKLRVFMREDHPLARKEKIRLTELATEPLVLFDREYSLYRILMQEFQAKLIQPNIILQSHDWEFLTGMIAEGSGVSVLPECTERFLPRAYANIVSRPLVEPVVQWIPGLIWKKKSYASSPAEVFVDYFRKYFIGEVESKPRHLTKK